MQQRIDETKTNKLVRLGELNFKNDCWLRSYQCINSFIIICKRCDSYFEYNDDNLKIFCLKCNINNENNEM
jgi:hypothetical protein